MPAQASDSAYNPESVRDARLARRRSSRMLSIVLALGAVAAFLSTIALLTAPRDMTIGHARAHGLALIAGILAAVLLAAAFWQRYLIRTAGRDCHLLQRTVEALRRREAYDAAEFALMSRISGLIEIFTHTRNLEAVLNEAVRALKATLQIDALVLQLYDEDVGQFTLTIEDGAGPLDLGEITRRTVIEKGKSVLVNQLAATGGFPPLAEAGYTSLMVAPLGRGRRATDRSIGLIAALQKGERDFTGRELTLLTHFARHAGLIIENAQLYKRAEHLAEHDGLTNLFNQRHFVTTLNAEIAKAARLNAPVAVIMGDLDTFKQYNDTHGHPKGDVVLRQIARILSDNIRQRDIVARYGGEEFVVILPATGHRGAQRVADTIRSSIEQFVFEGEEVSGKITITLGVAVFPGDAADAETLIQKADEALYRGKREGKNRVCWASSPPSEDAPAPTQPPKGTKNEDGGQSRQATEGGKRWTDAIS